VKIPALVEIAVDFWRRRRVLVTGHTGFKGAWLSLWLQHLGAQVDGLAPAPPTRPSLFELARVGEHMQQHAVDVRDARAVRECVLATRPEVVFHLAAQPMVRRSLAEPALTYEVNVGGTANVLEALRERSEELLAVVVVTSDKCYENDGSGSRRFREQDPLGGSDPYSSSKACAELVARAYRDSIFGGSRIATARAGNVIGGGDWGEDRLLADAVRAVEGGERLLVRNPTAVRPWQHVLNALSGYLLLAQACGEPWGARAWNFGPAAADERPVEWILERLVALWEGRLQWELDGRAHPSEAGHLALDSSAAERELGWRPPWELARALELIVEWHRGQLSGASMRELSVAQIEAFEAAAATGEAPARDLDAGRI
jgi:CDP-glucose 4,6-dehydratase